MEVKRTEDENKEDYPEETRFPVLLLPPVAQSILQFLSARDLSSCAMACTTWNAEANAIEEKRRTIVVIEEECKPEFHKLKLLLPKLQNIWWLPDVAMCVEESEKLRKLYCYKEEQKTIGDSDTKRKYRKGVQKAKEEATRIRNRLPSKCKLFHPPSHLFCDLCQFFHGFRRRQKHRCPKMIFFPKVSGLNVQAFVDLYEEEENRFDEVKPIILSEGTASDVNDIKCLVFMACIGDPSPGPSLKAKFQNGINEDTIVIKVATARTVARTGILFAGERVLVKPVAANLQECCFRHCFFQLHEYHDASGIVYLDNNYCSLLEREKYFCIKRETQQCNGFYAHSGNTF